MKVFVFMSVLFLVFAFVSGSQAEIYQYKDKNGVVVITDKKPNSKAKKVTTFKTPEATADKPGGQDAQKENKSQKSEAVPPQSIDAQEEKKAAAEAQKKRNEEADRLEAEARKTEQFSKEKQIEQREKLERAKNLRKGIDQPSDSAGR